MFKPRDRVSRLRLTVAEQRKLAHALSAHQEHLERLLDRLNGEDLGASLAQNPDFLLALEMRSLRHVVRTGSHPKKRYH